MDEQGRILIWVLAFVVAAGVGFGALVGIGCALGANSCPFTDSKQITATDGKVLYESLCIACHGPGGVGTRHAPALTTGPAATMSLDQLKAKISRGKPLNAMPAFKRSLNDQQIEAVATHVMTFRGDQ